MSYAITVFLSRRQLLLGNGAGRTYKTYPVGVGKSVTPTPPGQYYIVNKHAHPGGPFGVMWMGLNLPHYGIHGTNDPSSIGRFVSHGCIRMHNRDVAELAGRIPIGTPVKIVP